MLDQQLFTIIINPIIWYSILGIILFHIMNVEFLDFNEGLEQYTGMYPNVTFAEYEFEFEWKYDLIEMKDSMSINGHWNLFKLSYFFQDENFYNESIINFLNKKKIIFKKKIWIDIWEINTKISSLESHDESSWFLYYKYKLTMFNTWHVLEDRILNFFCFILFFFS